MSEWTEERIELLKTLWLEGATSTVISQRLQISRSAALGKIRRLGMQRNAMTQQEISVESGKASNTFGSVPLKEGISAVAGTERTEKEKSEKLNSHLKVSSAKHNVGVAVSRVGKSTGAKPGKPEVGKPTQPSPKIGKIVSDKPTISERTLETLTSAFLHKKAQSDLERQQNRAREEKIENLSFSAPSPINLPFQVVSPLPGRTNEKGSGITIWELRDNLCKWPMGGLLDPPELFCGAPVVAGCPWCTEHRAVAFTREPSKDAAGSLNKQPKR